MKKRLGCALLLLVMMVVLPNRVPSAAQDASPQAGANGAPPQANPLKLALLRWYKANTVFTMFPVGNQPYGVAFDGANIWTANWNDGTVTKLQANDGTVLGTFSSGGGDPYGVTFDGANIWVSNESGSVSKLRASDGKNLGMFAVALPGWMTFDSDNIWVPSAGSQGNGSLYKLRASDGKVVGTFTVGMGPLRRLTMATMFGSLTPGPDSEQTARADRTNPRNVSGRCKPDRDYLRRSQHLGGEPMQQLGEQAARQ